MAQTISDLYHILTGRKVLFNIMPIRNIPSVIQHGIVCFDTMKRFPHISVALEGVQARRDNVIIPNGKRLHSYANLYFAYDNPMLYKRQDQAEELCILAVNSKIMDVDGCIVSDQNAAANLVRFYPPEIGLNSIAFDLVFAKFWTHPDDPILQMRHKSIKCAEVLIPECVPYRYISGACVFNQDSSDRMQLLGFDKKLVIDRRVFYR